MLGSDKTISGILRHDRKVNSYKIALVRAVNDIVLGFPDLRHEGRDIAVPLRMLAEFWLAYYWPFVDPVNPIKQGGAAVWKNDITFRPELTALRHAWESLHQTPSNPADGFLLRDEMRIPRRRQRLLPSVEAFYMSAIQKVMRALEMPIRYAGPGHGQWTVFGAPKPYIQTHGLAAVPGTLSGDKCVIVPAGLWQVFWEMSLWVEALCVHEWCMFTETIKQEGGACADRGVVYRLLTARPDSRRPLTWERNQIDVLLLEGRVFRCPWTGKVIGTGTDYALDHLLPIAVYPINELWNLVPADSRFNSHQKRDRMPSPQHLASAEPHLVTAYTHYGTLPTLCQTLASDVGLRFASLTSVSQSPLKIAKAVLDLLGQFAEQRNLPRF